ncbi:2-oxo-4-hydroxy-4-carboxy-5-ureidoimidazoline decarboxylase [Streptomyces sp. NPDC049813]|uniref:2-oxo-4-hydroxy-4-carboxy-5-ureidoimidazoline decarboxylase n=1 Tax=Streptomyces sp. NPDC049813 TaxID=3365597 RepID=UPI0037BC19C7
MKFAHPSDTRNQPRIALRHKHAPHTHAPRTPHAPNPSRRRHPLSAPRALHVPGRRPIPAATAGSPGGLAHFNGLAQAAAEDALYTCCASRPWARRLAAHRPYPDLDSLLAAADEAAYDLTPAAVTEALAREELPRLPGAAACSAASAAHTALAAAHSAYESRFGHSFVICLDDAAPGEELDHLLSALRDRLGNDREEERVVAAEELRRLARGRIARFVRALPAARTGTPGAAREESVGDSPYVPV